MDHRAASYLRSMDNSKTPAKRPQKAAIGRRALLLGAGAGIGSIAMYKWQQGKSLPADLLKQENGLLILNDASELSATPVWRAEKLTAPPRVSTPELVRQVQVAAKAGRPVAVSAARHSQGGQSLAKDGLAVELDQPWVSIDTESQTYKVGGGARWHHVIAALDPVGFSPMVMQSNNDFGVASTFSVNAHGWPVPYSGCGSTVRTLKLLTPAAEVITCSRAKNPKIFSAAMGGYGLFGAITELELDMVPNTRLEPRFEVMPARAFGPRFQELVRAGDGVSMAYGRLDVSHDSFFEQAMAITYRPSLDQENIPPAAGSGTLSKMSRSIFRAQTENEWAKDARWWIERDLGPRIGGGAVTRNNLLNEPVVTLEDRDPSRTDILHEYFVAPAHLERFLQTCRDVIPNSYQQLLNVTLRYVVADSESLLAYAPEDRIAAVMLFSQEKTARAEADMKRMTRLLIDGVLAAGGSYYLPYRLHATREQFEAAYPRARTFARAKLQHDPEVRFSNAFWTTYLEHLT